MKHSFSQKVLGAFLMIGVAFTFAAPVDASSVKDLQSKKEKLNSDIESTKKKIRDTKKTRDSELAKLEDINRNLNDVQATIRQLRADIAVKESNIIELEKQVAASQAAYDEQMKAFDKRLVEIYKHGDVKLVDIVFGSESLNDMLTRYQYWQYITENDKKVLNEIAKVKTQLENSQNALVSERNALTVSKNAEENQSAILSSQQAEKNALVKDLEADEAKMSEMMTAMSNSVGEINAEIDRLLAEEAARQAAIKAQQEAAAKAAAQGGGAPSNGTVEASVQNNFAPAAGAGMVFPAPASYGVTSPYGYRNGPFAGPGEFHYGVDLGAASGSPAVAAQSGTVLIATYHWSYGNYMVVDHGNGLSTLYAHLSGFAASVGTQVSAGQQIGYIGSTGMSTGSHLHFEVRVNGQIVNPHGYIGV